MKKFFLKIFIVALAVFIVGVIVEFALFRKPNDYNYRLDYIKEHGHDIRTLILGHSQMVNGVIPEVIGDSVFSCAVNGKPNYVDHSFLEKYLHLMPNLRCIVFPIAYENNYVAPIDNKGRDSFRILVMTRINKYWDIPVEGLPKWRCWSEIINSHGSVLNDLPMDMVACRPSGWEPTSHDHRIAPDDMYQIVNVDFDSPDIKRYQQSNIDHMRAIATICREHDIKLIVLTTPYLIEQCEGITPRSDLEFNRFADEMLEANPDALYFNYMDDLRFGFDDFFDHSHLNRVGALKFSEILRDEVFNSLRL